MYPYYFGQFILVRRRQSETDRLSMHFAYMLVQPGQPISIRALKADVCGRYARQRIESSCLAKPSTRYGMQPNVEDYRSRRQVLRCSLLSR